ncbi:transport protein Avl9-domain-containing protein [Myxozyma melibiosi]|uniref:Transport protein Avl9-domain-containing protein n=1 Tax=Myxozyma melibiosi TaxID=54550 RepID=A0ABR1F743_9ASCO
MSDNESSTSDEGLIVGVCVVGFHHTRGPEVEYWIGENGKDMSTRWPNLPFQSLPDGSHSHEEDYSYFTLIYEPTPDEPDKEKTTYFGISCNRQIRTTELVVKAADVTRSTVQKSVVVVARKPIFGPIREKLAVVTRAYFLQANFEDRTIIKNLYDNLVQLFHSGICEADLYNGMTLRELVHRFSWKTLVLFKALILEPKILFFGSNTELLCSSQFSLVSLIPGLIEHLQDCASPAMDSYERSVQKSTSLRSSDRASLLAFMGLPLQVFGKGGMFNPYTPLQQLETLTSEDTKFYLIGSTNSLLLSQKHKFADILVNVDDNTVEILNPDLEAPLHLTTNDRRWIDGIAKAVNESWTDDGDGNSASVMFVGSEDYIRWQFEDYIMALLSSVKYDQFLQKYGNPPPPEVLLPTIEGNPVTEFNLDFVFRWKRTNNYKIFQSNTDEELFDVVEPRHSYGGGLSLEDVQRKVAQQMQNLAPAREALAKTFVTGGQKVSTAFGNFWSEIESMREKERMRKEVQKKEQKKKAAAAAAAEAEEDRKDAGSPGSGSTISSKRSQHITVSDPSYLTSWSRWAADKRRQAFGSTRSTSSSKLSYKTSSSSTTKPSETRVADAPLSRKRSQSSDPASSTEQATTPSPAALESEFEEISLSASRSKSPDSEHSSLDPPEEDDDDHDNIDDDDDDDDEHTYTPISSDDINPWKGIQQQ